MRFLARAVHVAEAERHVPRRVEAVPGREVLLAAQLGGAVGGERPQRRRLGRGAVAFAVGGAAGRREHHLRVVAARGLEDPDRPEHVDVGVEIRTGD